MNVCSILFSLCGLICSVITFFFLFIQIFFLTLTDDQPKYILGESLIGRNPGLGIRPREVKNYSGYINTLLLRFPVQFKVINFENIKNFNDIFFRPKADLHLGLSGSTNTGTVPGPRTRKRYKFCFQSSFI